MPDVRSPAVINLSVDRYKSHKMARLMPTFGENAKAALVRAGQTAFALAEKLGITSQSADKYFNKNYNNPEMDTIFAVAVHTRASVESLLSGVNAEYDAMRAAANVPEQLVDFWNRIPDRRGQKVAWLTLQYMAGVKNPSPLPGLDEAEER